MNIVTRVSAICIRALAALLAIAVFCAHAAAEETPCPLPGQTPALLVQMYFGQSIAHRGPVTRREWDDFLRHTVTPRFPDGLTVYDAYGQWQDRDSKQIARERAKVIEIATENTEAVRARIIAISDAYRKRFHQQSVAIVSHMACVAFT
jgi:hypothetical protein